MAGSFSLRNPHLNPLEMCTRPSEHYKVTSMPLFRVDYTVKVKHIKLVDEETRARERENTLENEVNVEDLRQV